MSRRALNRCRPASLTVSKAECASTYTSRESWRRRCFSSIHAAAINVQTRHESEPPAYGHLAQKAKEKQANKEFFIDLLSSAATKRDAKAYLSRLKAAPPHPRTKPRQDETSLHPEKRVVRPEVNLGAFFGHARAVEQSPKFTQHDNSALTEMQQAHHLALVKLFGLEDLDGGALQGLGLTLSQLCRLGMTPCVVLELGSNVREDGQSTGRQKMTSQADRLQRAVRSNSGVEARVLDNVFASSNTTSLPYIFSRRLLMSPIRNGQIPVILPLAYSQETQTVTQITADQAILALTREFAGLNVQSLPDEDPEKTRQRVNALREEISLDRLIILDPQGGIPHPAVPGSFHVFLNMEQEFHDVREELLDQIDATGVHSSAQSVSSKEESFFALRTGPNAISPQADREEVVQDVFLTKYPSLRKDGIQPPAPDFARHLANLDLLRDVLAYLPPSSSAIVTTPIDAAKSSKTNDQNTSISGVATRTQKNPLIHNLLTNRPPHSASLPKGRLGLSSDPGMAPFIVSTPTFVKRGMPLTIIPDPRKHSWTANNYEGLQLKLTDPRIDLSRLVHLIDDSFNRKLDVEHYLNRVNDRIAGLIIAGEYEGGAIFTWETPTDVSSSDMSRRVPYLDKFAVLKRSQGAGGVADVVFNAMVRGCFPDGVCWRSRRYNPVNKWYFERARGTWKLPGTNWTMFWTTEGVEAGAGQRFNDYEAVCRGVEPSWADKKVAD